MSDLSHHATDPYLAIALGAVGLIFGNFVQFVIKKTYIGPLEKLYNPTLVRWSIRVTAIAFIVIGVLQFFGVISK
ncbi:MAG: hypothetical protein ACXWR1_02585 [Bdellovibrionota bacterium]